MRFAMPLLAATAAAAAAPPAPSFDEFCAKFHKFYPSEEYAQRRALFEERVAQHERWNQRPGSTWTAGVGPLTDLFPHELQKRFGYNKAMRQPRSSPGAALTALAAQPPEGVPSAGGPPAGTPAAKPSPARVDWREKSPSVVSPVKDQLGCGSCWAFAAVSAIESHVAIETGVLMDLSPQQLNSCTENPRQCGGSGGCTGAVAQLAFNYTIHNGGVASIWTAPYSSGISGSTEACASPWSYPPAASITGYEELPANDAQALMEAVATVGPVVVNVDASGWYMYQGGIYDACNKTHPITNHAVVLVGYGQENGVKYWLIRNSWGTQFGENGYMRLRRYDDEPCGVDTYPQYGTGCAGGAAEMVVCGECGVLSDSTYPTGGRVGGAPGGARRRLEASAPLHV